MQLQRVTLGINGDGERVPSIILFPQSERKPRTPGASFAADNTHYQPNRMNAV